MGESRGRSEGRRRWPSLGTRVVPRRRLLVVPMTLVAVAVWLPPASGASPPVLAFTPSSWDYGTLGPGTTSSKTFVLRNNGGSGSAELTVSVSGSSAFTKTSDTCTGKGLGPNKTCSVTVQYAPTSAGSTDNGTLTASSKKASASAALTGTSTGGNQAPIVQLTVVSTTPPFNFGDTVSFTVTVTDDQPVDCARVGVAYIFGHEQHGHPQNSTVGCTGQIDAPFDQGHTGAANVFALFHASYTDPSGEVGTAEVRLTQFPQSEADCESFGGIFILGIGRSMLWECIVPFSESATAILNVDCLADGGTFFGYPNPPNDRYRCV
jgi:hypothetical protein